MQDVTICKGTLQEFSPVTQRGGLS